MLSPRNTSQGKDIHRLKVKGWKITFHTNGIQRQVGIANLISDRVNFKSKLVKRHKEGNYILLKRRIQ